MAVIRRCVSLMLSFFNRAARDVERIRTPVAPRLNSPGPVARPKKHRCSMEGIEMKRFTRATAMLTVAGMIMMTNAAFAADPTQADFDTCNREAQGGTPAASPGS